MIVKKLLITTAFFTLLNFSAFTQELEKTAEIEVSATKKVITFQAKNTTTMTSKDTQEDNFLTVAQTNIINKFLSIQGVQSATYDKATSTYTVVANITTIIEFPFILEK